MAEKNKKCCCSGNCCKTKTPIDVEELKQQIAERKARLDRLEAQLTELENLTDDSDSE